MKITPLESWIASKIGESDGCLTREQLAVYQLQKLRATIRLARERSRFYRQHLAAAPADLSCLADLACFPLTTAQDICADALRFLCVSQGDIQRVVTLDSSGTTGTPKRLYFTLDDQELTTDFFRVGMSTLVEAGDRVLILLPGERPGSVGDLLAVGLQRLGVQGIKHGPVRDVAQTLAVMAREQVNSLVGIPAQVLALARYRDSNGLPVPLQLKSALLTTDYVPPAIVYAVEEAWGCQVYNHYGMTEMGLGGGVECQARRGYHLREADLYFEIVDPATGLPVADGEGGEVVFTTLTRQGMPLIRYRTGDLSSFLSAPCPCGTALRTMERVRGRLAGRVAVGQDLYLTMADLDDALFPIAALLDFTATITREDGLDRLCLEVQVAPGARDAVASALLPALNSVPAFRRARAAGHLEVTMDLRASDYRCAPSPAKRTILDMRGKG